VKETLIRVINNLKKFQPPIFPQFINVETARWAVSTPPVSFPSFSRLACLISAPYPSQTISVPYLLFSLQYDWRKLQFRWSRNTKKYEIIQGQISDLINQASRVGLRSVRFIITLLSAKRIVYISLARSKMKR